jgi:hypothetical protein
MSNKTTIVNVVESDVFGVKAYHCRCQSCGWVSNRVDRESTAIARAHGHVCARPVRARATPAAEREGRRARLSGKGKRQNPYCVLSESFRDWRAGWERADSVAQDGGAK